MGQEPSVYRKQFSVPAEGDGGGGEGDMPELKVASFGTRLSEYLEQYCALRVRQAFEGLFQEFDPRVLAFYDNVKTAHAETFLREPMSSLGPPHPARP